MRGTFSMANVSPQDASFNRGVWLRMEEWTRSLLRCDEYKEVSCWYYMTYFTNIILI